MKKFLAFLLTLISVSILSFSFSGCDTKASQQNLVEDKEGDIVSPVEKNYTVNFVENGGNEVDSTKVKVLTSAPKTSRAGFLFDGWFMDSDFTNAARFPLTVAYDMTLYAKWIKLTDTMYCTSCSIKDWAGYDPAVTWYITPSGFEMRKLAEMGYTMRITVSYSVYYEKDYDLPIGYAGSPKYEVYIFNSDGLGTAEEDLKTTSKYTAHEVYFTCKVVDLLNQQIKLTFSTNNIQNIIHFKSIIISYECFK
ncbi:MAG: InlB B-repeat-containing protein [Clostridia bacterium]|nr:InlB B-repeat-containing protein [Clostridia bacterium]